MVYLVEWNDEDGDLADRSIYCNRLCADRDPVTKKPNTEQGNWPGGWESDHNEYCPSCGTMLSHGLEESADDTCEQADCHDCPPVVVNLIAPMDKSVLCETCGCVQYLDSDLVGRR